MNVLEISVGMFWGVSFMMIDNMDSGNGLGHPVICSVLIYINLNIDCSQLHIPQIGSFGGNQKVFTFIKRSSHLSK